MANDMLTVGICIGEAIDQIETAVAGITKEELAEFRRYTSSLETTMPITDPTLYARRGARDIERAKARVGLIEGLKQFFATEQEG